MIIGTVRVEEARVFDSFEGYHRFHAEETQEELGSFLVYWENGQLLDFGAGWYWVSEFPGCLPDGERSGPFASSRQALESADEWNPEFDDDYA